MSAERLAALPLPRRREGPQDVTEDPQPDPVEDDADSPFVDVAAFLAGGLPEPPKPTVLYRQDDHALFYAGKVNVLFGDPECGKSWIAYAAVVEALGDGQTGLILDADHNGPQEILARLLLLGAKPDVLGDPALFRLAEPEDKEQLLRVVDFAVTWRPAVAVVDNVGRVTKEKEVSPFTNPAYDAVNVGRVPYAEV